MPFLACRARLSGENGGVAAQRAFEWVGGEACLDFNNTVSWNRDGLREERLLAYPDLVAWAVEEGTLRGPGPLLDEARHRPRAAAGALARAREVRSVLHDVFRRLAHGGRPTPKHVLALERFLSEGFHHLGVTARGRGYAWTWPAPGRDLARPLWPVAWSAARLLTSAELVQVRACANEDCGWLFVDRSRRGNRRWCDMAECGSRDKARRHYRRKSRERGSANLDSMRKTPSIARRV